METFEISRVSNYWNYEKPCEEAYESDKRFPNPKARDYLIDLEWTDLPKFIDKYGTLVLDQGDKYLTLEIYDDYRE